MKWLERAFEILFWAGMAAVVIWITFKVLPTKAEPDTQIRANVPYRIEWK